MGANLTDRELKQAVPGLTPGQREALCAFIWLRDKTIRARERSLIQGEIDNAQDRLDTIALQVKRLEHR